MSNGKKKKKFYAVFQGIHLYYGTLYYYIVSETTEMSTVYQ